MQFITKLSRLQLQVYTAAKHSAYCCLQLCAIKTEINCISEVHCSDNATALLVNIGQRLASAGCLQKDEADVWHRARKSAICSVK